MARRTQVSRPIKRTEFRIEFATRVAEQGWRDLAASKLSALADAWDDLTKDPKRNDPKCHPMRGQLGVVMVLGTPHVRRQYELPGGARIWYYVVDGNPGTVLLLEVHTRHPNQTK